MNIVAGLTQIWTKVAIERYYPPAPPSSDNRNKSLVGDIDDG